jgi:NADPH:quinone reductase
VIAYGSENVAERVNDITGGAGVAVSYDAVEANTFEGSLTVLATKGHLVHFGQASGTIPPFELSRLSARYAKVLRPFLWPYLTDCSLPSAPTNC